MSGSCSVLMVCLGNICRSPIAEALLRHKWEALKAAQASSDKLKFADVTVDSCGTAGYHIGSSPDRRGVSTMKKHGVKTNHKARKLKKTDGDEFDFIFCMDYSNLSDCKSILPKSTHSKLHLLGSFDPDGIEEVDDPYYGPDDGFEECFQHCSRCLDKFIEQQLIYSKL